LDNLKTNGIAGPASRTQSAAAVQEERRRISGVARPVLQLLTTIQLRSSLPKRTDSKPEQLERELKPIAEASHKAATEIRSLLLEKQVIHLAAGTLERRLKDEMEIFRARTGLKLKFECAIDAHNLPYDVEQELYFALREGIINAIRHSRATELNLSLDQNQTTCRVHLKTMELDLTKFGGRGGGFGLKGMKESRKSGSSHH
jgi:signal transduction histidine kinase